MFNDNEILEIKENLLDITFLPHFPLQFTLQTTFIAIIFSNLHPKW